MQAVGGGHCTSRRHGSVQPSRLTLEALNRSRWTREGASLAKAVWQAGAKAAAAAAAVGRAAALPRRMAAAASMVHGSLRQHCVVAETRVRAAMSRKLTISDRPPGRRRLGRTQVLPAGSNAIAEHRERACIAARVGAASALKSHLERTGVDWCRRRRQTNESATAAENE